ncbi:transmembrane protein 41A-like [Clytia hemisphaerica]|uniref:VTT domain-containing protein n=1 Tax=Clytia hemisphaerica TaxID=252671 RepID=A0A7M6DKZ2_9CNID
MKPKFAVLGLLMIFACSSVCLYLLSSLLPANNGRYKLGFPSNLENLKSLVEVMKRYKEDHFYSVMIVFCAAYLYKQTFSIPGSVFMNLLAGALFGMPLSFVLACLLSASGATCCFLLSMVFGRSILMHYFKEKVVHLQTKLDENSDGLFFYLLCVRLFPMTPNWLLNMTFPILGVPMHLFFPSVFIGLMPYNFICCQTGCILSEISSVNDIMTTGTILKLTLVAMVVALPGYLMRRKKKVKKN